MTSPITTLTALTWPSPREAAILSAITIVVSVASALAIWGVDLGLTAGLSLL